MRLPKFLREPLVVFAGLGGAFFLLYNLSTADERVIEVSKADQDSRNVNAARDAFLSIIASQQGNLTSRSG